MKKLFVVLALVAVPVYAVTIGAVESQMAPLFDSPGKWSNIVAGQEDFFAEHGTYAQCLPSRNTPSSTSGGGAVASEVGDRVDVAPCNGTANLTCKELFGSNVSGSQKYNLRIDVKSIEDRGGYQFTICGSHVFDGVTYGRCKTHVRAGDWCEVGVDEDGVILGACVGSPDVPFGPLS